MDKAGSAISFGRPLRKDIGCAGSVRGGTDKVSGAWTVHRGAVSSAREQYSGCGYITRRLSDAKKSEVLRYYILASLAVSFCGWVFGVTCTHHPSPYITRTLEFCPRITDEGAFPCSSAMTAEFQSEKTSFLSSKESNAGYLEAKDRSVFDLRQALLLLPTSFNYRQPAHRHATRKHKQNLVWGFRWFTCITNTKKQ